MLRHSLYALTGLFGLVASACAADSTSPFIMRSSSPSSTPKHALCGHSHAEAGEVYKAMREQGCDWDALIVVDMDGLRPAHLPAFHAQLASSPSSLDIPHVKRSSSADLRRASKDLVRICSTSGGEGKVLVNVRGSAVEDVTAEIADAVSAYPSHLIIFHGTRSLKPSKRQLLPPTSEDLSGAIAETAEEFEQELAGDEVAESTWVEEAEGMLEDWFPSLAGGKPNEEDIASQLAGGVYDDEDEDEDEDNYDGYWDMLAEMEKNGNGTSNSTLPLLQRAQILSTPVITALLVSFGILIPILTLGVYALTTIQVPPYMMSIAKSGVSQSKKDQ